MDDYKQYLAEHVLSEDKIITYRALSRALKVNVNVAKQMLYDFHAWQNNKRSGAVHATYMVYGIKKAAQTNGHSQHDGDVEMTSSPPEVGEAAEEVPVMTLSLVAEENLKEVLSQYETVTSMHVYSLGPHPDLQLLADVSKPILDRPAEDGSVNPPRPLGSIRNPYVRRRERRGAVPRPAAATSKPSNARQPASKHVPAAEPAPAAKAKEEPKAEQKPTSKESTPVPSGAKKSAVAPKRGGSGGIMQSFAKAASMPKKEKTSETATPIEEDQVLSDDGEDDSVPVPEPKKESETAGKSRKERQAELRRMMEEDSEDEEEPEKEDTPMEEPEEEEAPTPEPEKKEEPEPAEVISSTGDGRRRGKRRVMKKKTVMDDQGYLVTVQELGWESFSEDEPTAPPKKKTQLTSQPAKAKKPAPKGQGNIMSFFSKK
ncbi:DNA polymerase delta subunit 3 [Cytospora mali]|uniref:DNA polymerase delta subunit 3 n=1 Tax=Cytospora mali TaxID=578113 RepID=A0A194UU26_CYTMA|nr:DNA polymerase delta subunit 3 [Valsa mali var. pyri (nom. inval.)]